MILFDPLTLTRSLTQAAEELRSTADAPATLVQIDRGPLMVSVATGVSDLKSGRNAEAVQTYEIGSQTKLMTAVAILQLAEQGKLDLDAAAASYVPGATLQGIANAGTVTVRQLLNMTAGIENYTEVRDAEGVPEFINALLAHPDQIFGPAQALDLVRGAPALSAPGAEYYYSNTNYTLLGQIIEAQTGQSYFDALHDGILAPAGMTRTVPQLGTEDRRLSSYLEDPESGTLIDVTRAQWEMRGEAGFASTTTDMVRFLKALFVEKTLLSDTSLAEMMTYVPTGANAEIDTGFGLGLVKFEFIGGDTYVGFTGGTLATASSTYLNLTTGEVIAVGATSEAVDTLEGGFAVLQASREFAGFDLTDDGGPVVVQSGSAAQMTLAGGARGLSYSIDGATLTLARDLGSVTTETLQFSDGSVLVVGDNQAARGDAAGNEIDILRDFRTARLADNHLMGLGGDDVLKGGHGNDRAEGGGGADALWGRGGDDVLSGGTGDDALYGGDGADRLTGGAGRGGMRCSRGWAAMC